jgi:hypothetical protein
MSEDKDNHFPIRGSESVKISKEIKRRLQEHCHQWELPLKQTLDAAVSSYVQEKTIKE